MHRKKGGCRRKTTKPVKLKTYRNGGMGSGARALVHKGEMIIKSPFKRP